MKQQMWWALYNRALAETDPLEKRRMIDRANVAMCQRIDELTGTDVGAAEEYKEMMDALSVLRIIIHELQAGVGTALELNPALVAKGTYEADVA